MERMGSAELTDWMAFYELETRDKKQAVADAVEEAKRNVR